MLKVQGIQRFRIVTSAAQSDGLLHATVELLDEIAGYAVPEAQQELLPLLRKIVSDLGGQDARTACIRGCNLGRLPTDRNTSGSTLAHKQGSFSNWKIRYHAWKSSMPTWRNANWSVVLALRRASQANLTISAQTAARTPDAQTRCRDEAPGAFQ